MEDIVPGLIEAVTDEFHRMYDGNSKIQRLLDKVKGGTATYAEAQEYAIEVSQIIGDAYRKHISSAVLPDGRMYYNIAQRLIPATLDENHELVSGYAVNVQQALNKKAGIGLKAQSAEVNQDRVDGLVDLASNEELYDDVSDQLLTAFENFSQNVVDETIKRNADFHYRSGLSPKIIRRAERKCCAWCRGLAGVHEYPDCDKEIYRRHENCRCTVLYDPADGKKSVQNVHSRKWVDVDAVEKRKSFPGLDTSRRGRIASISNSNPQNVTTEYLRKGTPGTGTIRFEEGYSKSRHNEEVNIAKWLFDNFGGEIVLLNESAIEGVKRADFLWNGALWDLKSLTSAKAADSAVRKGIKQIYSNPGGIILDIGSNSVSVEDLLEITNRRMLRSNDLEADIILVKQGKFNIALRYKK